jgi:2-oxoglutarate dehydrogenase E1 component
MHISDVEERRFLQERMEGKDAAIQFTPEGKKAILGKVIEAEQYEKFLGRKYVGTKRFGLDGGESMIPALEAVIKYGGQLGVREIVYGMPHRGRLNVLANVMAKPYRIIFHEFSGGSSNPDDVGGSGDVKYHLGTSTDREFDGIKVHMSLVPNPSHLEAVNPVVLGKVRANQTARDDLGKHEQVLPVLLHGDAPVEGVREPGKETLRLQLQRGRAQGFRDAASLAGVVADHRHQFGVRERHCQRTLGGFICGNLHTHIDSIHPGQ